MKTAIFFLFNLCSIISFSQKNEYGIAFAPGNLDLKIIQDGQNFYSPNINDFCDFSGSRFDSPDADCNYWKETESGSEFLVCDCYAEEGMLGIRYFMSTKDKLLKKIKILNENEDCILIWNAVNEDGWGVYNEQSIRLY